MKKLLIALTAVATGLFASTAAADEPTTYDAIGFDKLESNTQLDYTDWDITAGAPDKAWVTAVGDRTLPYGVGYPATGEGEEVNYLDVKTDLKKPIFRNGFADENLADTIFFDSLVKFTAADEDLSAADYSGSKIILYVKDNSEDETSGLTTTNLYALSKDYEGTPVAYDLGTIDIDSWHRVTIKAIKAANNGAEYAFEVYVDQMARKYSNTVTAFDTSTLTTAGKSLAATKKLIPSLIGTGTLTGVGFAGQGQIDDLVFTDSVDTWADEASFTLELADDKITAFTYTALDQDGNTLFTGDQDSASMGYVEGMKVRIDAVTYVAGQWSLSVAEPEFTFDPTTKTITGITENSVATLVANDVTPRVEVTIGAEVSTYPSIGAALAVINELPSGEVSIAFKKDQYPEGIVELGTVTDGSGDHTEATLTSVATITLDLAGCTIYGPAGIAEYVIESGSELIIVDTVGGGKVVPNTDNVGAVVVYDNNLSIAGGTFDGAVSVDGTGDVTITGGSFDYATNSADGEDKFKFELSDDYVAVKDDETNPQYWVVKDAPKAGVVVDATNATVDGVKTGDEFAKDATITFTATANENYTLSSVKIGEAEYGTSGSYEYTVTAADVEAEMLNITVVAAPTEWTITYYDDKEEEFATDFYNIENRTTKALNAGIRAGYKFLRWEDEEFNEVTSLAGLTGDIELYGIWEPLPAVAQINDGETYTSLAAAVAAAQSTDTITLLDDYTTGEDEQLLFSNAKFDLGSYTLNVASNICANGKFGVAEGATVTFTNGTINLANDGVKADAASYGFKLSSGANATVVDCTLNKANGPVFDIYGATLNINAIVVTAGDIFRFKDENRTSTVNITGGSYKDTATSETASIFHHYKPGHVANVNITGGEFDFAGYLIDCYQHETGAATVMNFITKFGKDCTVSLKMGKSTLVSPKAENPADKQLITDADLIASGYELVADTEKGEGWYKIAAKVSPYIDPTDPTSKQTVEATDPVDAVAKAQVAVPADAQAYVRPEAYKAYFNFTAVEAGEGKYDVSILGLKAEVVEAPTTADLVAKFDQIGEDGLVVVAKPGLFYGVKQAAAVGSVGTAEIQSAGMAVGNTVKLPVAKQGDAGFYKIVVDVKAFPVE